MTLSRHRCSQSRPHTTKYSLSPSDSPALGWSARVGNAQGNAFVLTLTKRATRGPNPSPNRPTIGPGTRADRRKPLADGGGRAEPPTPLPERHLHHRPPRRPERQHKSRHLDALCAAPVVWRCTRWSSAVESSVQLPPAALRRRNCEADHSLRTRLERTSVSTWHMHRWATSAAGDLRDVVSKAATMNRSQDARRPPALDVLWVIDGERQQHDALVFGRRQPSSSSAYSF